MDNNLTAQRRPCANCPWRLDAPIGEFEPDRFRSLARCGEDQSFVIFTCHKSTEDAPIACAGFLERGATHNLAIRLAYLGRLERMDRSGGVALHPNYRAMAVAQGVPADDPALANCRDDQ